MLIERSRPRLRVIDDFASESMLAGLLRCVEQERLERHGLTLKRDMTGQTLELPVAMDPALRSLAAALEEAIGIPNALPETLRLRIAERGDFHPLHSDDYEFQGHRLVATALVYLTPGVGGVTRFPQAEPFLQVDPVAGRAVVWLNLDERGQADPCAMHAIAPVLQGPRTTLAWFVYATLEQVAEAAERARGTGALVAGFSLTATRADSGALAIVVDGTTPESTRKRLHEAAAARNLSVRDVYAERLDPFEPPLEPGTLLYRIAVSWAAQRAERQLWQPGVRTFHRGEAGPFTICVDQWLAFARAGLPTPRSVRFTSSDPAFLSRALDAVGGLPVVVRTDEGEGGVGVMRADSLPALRSLADLCVSKRLGARIVAYVADAMHWRCIVLGKRVLTAYRNPIRPDDFRSEPSVSPDDYGLTAAPEMEQLAVAAARVAGTAFAGVDILVHSSGRMYVLEANFPCYFPQAERFGRYDVAGAMLDALTAQSYCPWDLSL